MYWWLLKCSLKSVNYKKAESVSGFDRCKMQLCDECLLSNTLRRRKTACVGNRLQMRACVTCNVSWSFEHPVNFHVWKTRIMPTEQIFDGTCVLMSPSLKTISLASSCLSSTKWLIGKLVQLSFSFSLYS